MTNSVKQVQSIVGYNGNRETNDFYVTPPEAVYALLGVESFWGKIWEPACGKGAISEVLKAEGHDVYSTDIVDRGYGDNFADFLGSYYPANSIVTNPPYNLAEKFVVHALNQSRDKVAMLLKLSFLEGQKRKILFETTPPKKVWVFSKRLSMYGDGKDKDRNSGMIAFAWFVWEHGYRGDTTIGWL
jgi:hypothetical protein